MNLKSCARPPMLIKKQGASNPKRLTMRLIGLLFIIFCLNINVLAQSQQITLNVKDQPLEKVLNEIKKQSGYSFFYQDHLLENAGKVTVSLKNVPIKEALDKCLKNQNLTYEFVGNTIAIKSKPQTQQQKTSTQLPDITIKGRISDTTNAPIKGASIRVEGSNISAATDNNGEFTITLSPNSIINIIAIGFQPQNIAITNNQPININLHQSTSKLDEVQVIAYGTTTQRLTTGSISKVSADAIESQPVTNPLATLAGRVPGLFITQSNGLPGSGFNVQIGGKGSISQGTLPLYVIDGVPFDAGNPTQLVTTGSLNVVNPFNSINPGDIESIEVLKDADATSIYGSRGANGVILITTKKPKVGSLNLSLNTYTGWGNVTRFTNYLDGSQYRSLRRQAFRNDGVTPTLGNAPDLLALDTTIINNFNQQLIGKTSRTDNLQLNISGGNTNTKFSIGGNYSYENTVFPDNNFASRKSLNFSLSHSSSDNKFNALFTSAYSYNRSDLISMDLTNYLAKVPYGFQLSDDKGNLIWNDAAHYYGNPLSFTNNSYNGITDLLTTSGVLSYKVVSGLQIKANAGYNVLNFDEQNLSPIIASDPSFNVTGNAAFGHNTTRNWSIEPQIEYSGLIAKKLKFISLIGGSWQESENLKNVISGSGYTSDALIGSIAGAAQTTATNSYSLYRYNAVFARETFNWDDTYILNFTGRRDGSSRFGPGNQFANFGSVGAAWIFSQYNLLHQKFPILSLGKLRFSYGTSGNDQIGNYSYLDSYTASPYLYQQSLSLQPTRLFNKDYSWEQNNKLDVAIELGFFHDRLYLSANYFRNRSDNQLINYTLPEQTGFQNVLVNFPGKVQNKGWEFEFHSDNIKSNKISWSSAFNLTIPKNTLLAFPGLANSSYANSLVIGQPLSVRLGYKFLGVDPVTGSYKVWDKNNDGAFTSADYVVEGNFDPRFYGGFQNTIKYRKITLDFLFQFVKQLGLDPIYSSSTPIGLAGNLPVQVLDHWKNPGDMSAYAKPTEKSGTDLYKSYSLAALSSASLTDASYIRLKNVSIYYSLPTNWTNSIGLKSLSLFLQGQNLITITSYKGSDPETQSRFILPPLRVVAAGVKATL